MRPKYSLDYFSIGAIDRYFESRLSSPDTPVTIGIVRDDVGLVGAVGFHSYHAGQDVVMALVIDDPGCMRRRDLMREVMNYPFLQLGLERVSAAVDKSNERCQKLLLGLGFSCEGVKRKAAADGGDQLIFGLLKEEFRCYGQSAKTTTRPRSVSNERRKPAR